MILCLTESLTALIFSLLLLFIFIFYLYLLLLILHSGISLVLIQGTILCTRTQTWINCIYEKCFALCVISSAPLYFSFLSFFNFKIWGAHSVEIMSYTWFCAQNSLLAVQGTIGRTRAQTLLSRLQGKHTCHCAICPLTTCYFLNIATKRRR